MALLTPNLDDRKFQDLVDEARRMIPRYCPEWTDHNLSDPGITLVELFAWLVEIMLYRLNKVPDKNYVKFLELMGVKLAPARAARADITFRLSAPQPETIVIPKGTEVATVRTETQDAITFTTDRDLRIQVPTLIHTLVTRDGSTFYDYAPALKEPDLHIGIFQDVPQPGNALYLGYGQDLAAHTLALTIVCDQIEGIGVNPYDPPLSWEYFDGVEQEWTSLTRHNAGLERDDTGGLNRSGMVVVQLPYEASTTEVDGKRSFWLRCVATKPGPGQGSYSASPRLNGIITESIGGLVPASHAAKIVGEPLGISNGEPGQVFRLLNAPILPRSDGETIEIETEDGEYAAWQEVDTFAFSGPTDSHFMCDSVSGEVSFGPRVRQPNGEERQFGRVPVAGRQIRFSSYRYGGGVSGNVGQGTLTVLKSSIPYVAWVRNQRAAMGGLDPETLDNARLWGPQALRARTRAVTSEDFEQLALQATSEVARARCLAPGSAEKASATRPGAVTVLLVPAARGSGEAIPKDRLDLPPQLRQAVKSFLDERRLLGVELNVGAPSYTWIAVAAVIRTKRKADRERVRQEAERQLYDFLNPVVGGADGQGWPFGRPLHVGEVYSVLQNVPGVDFVEEAQITVIDPDTGEVRFSGQKVDIEPDGLICSYRHFVTAS